MYCIQTGPFGVNTYIVELGPGKCFVVDFAGCDFCGDAHVLQDFLGEYNLECVAFVFTHGHFDHVSGLKTIAELWPEAKVLIHSLDRDFIGVNSGVLQGKSLFAMGFGDFIPTVSGLKDADGFLAEGCVLSEFVPNVCTEVCNALSKWKVLHTPGHTEGSVCLYNEEERSLISGDTVFYHSWGRTDLPGGSELKIQKSLLRLYKNLPENTLVYPGHDYYGFVIRENF